MDLTAKDNIPDDWGSRAKCPICNAPGLRVLHIHGTPDLMVCNTCDTNYKIEEGGSHLWITLLPPMLQSHANLKDKWMTYDDIKKYITQFVGRNKTSSESAASVVPTMLIKKQNAWIDNLPSDEPEWINNKDKEETKITQDIKNKVFDLYRLGNSPDQIKTILIRSDGLETEEVEAAISNVVDIDRKKKSRQTRGLWIASIATLICLLAFIGALLVWAYISRNLNSIQFNPESLSPGCDLMAFWVSMIA